MVDLTNKRRSFVWNYFTVDEVFIHLAICDICSESVKRGETSDTKKFTTSLLIYHLRTQHGITQGDESKQKDLECFYKQNNSPILKFFKTQKLWDINDIFSVNIHNIIAKMIIIDLQPVSIVEDEGFAMLLKHLEPRYKIPSRKYFTERILPEIYDSMKNKIITELLKQDFLSFSTDMWTSKYTAQSYMCLTTHYLNDDFEPKSAAISCVKFDDIHTAENINLKFNIIIDEWNININKCFAIVHDNAANAKKAFGSGLILQTFCFSHTLQLVIKDAFRNNKLITDLFNKVRRIITHFKSSFTSAQKLRKIQEKIKKPHLRLIQDIVTRWNSSYYMIKRFLLMKDEIVIFLAENTLDIIVNAHEWFIIEELIKLLGPFEQITNEISNSACSISIVIPALKVLEKSLAIQIICSEVFLFRSQLNDSLNTRFSEILKNRVYNTATFLDPRFKKSFLDEKNFLFVKEELSMMISKNEVIIHENVKRETPTNPDDIWCHLNNYVCNDVDNKYTNINLNSEINTYVSESCMPKTTDIFLFWKQNSARFPEMSKNVRKFLSIPPTSVPSERVFSTAGDLVDIHRTNLLPENAEMLILLKINSAFIK